MTDEAKLIVNTLRACAVETQCSKCVVFCENNECLFTAAAKLIESLSAELEQIRQERDGLNILLGQAQSMLETRTRERDTAVKDLTLWSCFSCKHAGYACSEVCASCLYNRNRLAKGYVSGKNRYEWRGVQEEHK